MGCARQFDRESCDRPADFWGYIENDAAFAQSQDGRDDGGRGLRHDPFPVRLDFDRDRE
jgi:hypothetical protein